MSYRICTSCGASDGQGCYSTCPTMLQARVAELEKEVKWHKDNSARRGEAEAVVLRRIGELKAALQWIDMQRYTDRSTITPDNAFEQWTRLNADLVAIMDKARAALNPQQEE
ncbi:MAG: hypothetical protein K9G27_08995 [Sphingomonadaceae bacterium]|nr:hypothetical protein [Sphingomonadaceae bacterium]